MSDIPPHFSRSRRDFLRSTLIGGGTALSGLAALDAFARDPAPVDFRFVVISDSHIGHQGDVKRFYRALSLVKKEKADFILHTGDVVNSLVSDAAQMRSAKRALRRIPKPFYVVPGNHDVGWSERPELLRIWRETFGPTEMTFEHKGWTFVGLNTTALTERNPDRDEEDRIFAWLEFQAPAFNRGRTIFFYHMPNYKLPVNWSWLPDWSASAKARWDTLMGEIQPLAAIAGHWHLGVQVRTPKHPVIVAPSTSGRFNFPTGYLRCSIKGGKLLAERVMLDTENKRHLPAIVKLFLLPEAAPPRIRT